MIQYVDNRERNSLPTRRSSDLTGGVPMLFGYPFLKGWHGTVDLPLIGPVELATAMPFDAGVFLRSEEHTSELQSRGQLVCRLLLEKKNIDTAVHSIVNKLSNNV